jgi:hypothetical protein
MWIVYAVPLSFLAILFVALPSVLIARAEGRSGRHRVREEERPLCVHRVASAATGIACPCVLEARAKEKATEDRAAEWRKLGIKPLPGTTSRWRGRAA